MSDKGKKTKKEGKDHAKTPTKVVGTTKKVERGPHTLPIDDIDTQGKPITASRGGSVLFKCVEVKDLGKQSALFYTVKIDGEDKHHTKPIKGEKFTDHEALSTFALKVDSKLLTLELKDKGLISDTYLGEVRLNVEDLLGGYPIDKWFNLQGKAKEGKEKKEKKKPGQVHLQVYYIAPDKQERHDEFTKPLISLIARDRLDLFNRKIEDLGGGVSDRGTEKDAVTPLLFAAAEGKAGFVKILIENGASVSKEVDKEGQTAIHLAAKFGHHVILRYLLRNCKDVPINVKDTSPLKNTPLHLAASENQGESVAILIQAGADINALNGKKDTPLLTALCEARGAPTSVEELVKGGADVYALNADDLPAWEVAQRLDLCSSPQTRNRFMKTCEVIDAREFPNQQKLPLKTRVQGEDFSTDWTTATQFIVTAPETTEVTTLLYPIQKTEEYQKQIGFCVIKDNEPNYRLPSFQPEGIGFGGNETFKFVVEPEYTYTVCSFCTDKQMGDTFGLCFFQKAGSPQISVKAAKKFKHSTAISGAWKGDNAAGSSLPGALKNKTYILSAETEKESDAYIMLAQKSKDVSAIVFDDNRIVPAKFYIGIHVMGMDKKTVLAKSAKWHNSKEVYLKIRIGGENKQVIVVPSTLIPGEEIDYEITVTSDVKTSLKANK